MAHVRSWLRQALRPAMWPFIAVGVALVVRLHREPIPLIVPGFLILLAVSIVFSMTVVVVPIHEAGHVIAGWLVGFRFQLVRVGSLCIARDGDSITIQWRKGSPKIKRPFGLAVSLPREDRNLPIRIAVMLAGGAVANLVFGVLCIGAAWSIELQVPPGMPQASAAGPLCLLLLIFSLCSLALAIATLFAGRAGEVRSDGAKLRLLHRGGEAAERQCIRWAVEGMAKNAVPVSQWPDSVIEKAAAFSRGAGETGLLLVAYHSLLGRGDVLGAGQFLVHVLNEDLSLSTDLLARFWSEAAYLVARYAGDAPVARSFLDKAKALHPAEGAAYRHAETAVRITEGEGPAAPDQAGLRLKICARGRQAAEKQADNSWIQELSALLFKTPLDPHAEAAPPEAGARPFHDPS